MRYRSESYLYRGGHMRYRLRDRQFPNAGLRCLPSRHFLALCAAAGWALRGAGVINDVATPRCVITPVPFNPQAGSRPLAFESGDQKVKPGGLLHPLPSTEAIRRYRLISNTYKHNESPAYSVNSR